MLQLDELQELWVDIKYGVMFLSVSLGNVLEGLVTAHTFSCSRHVIFPQFHITLLKFVEAYLSASSFEDAHSIVFCCKL